MKILDSIDLSTYDKASLLETKQKVKGIVSTDVLPKFEHVDAESIEEAVFLLKTYGSSAALIAGGQDLLRELKARVRPTQPKVLINIKSIRPKLDYIKESAAGLTVGSLTTLHSIETSPLVKEKHDVLAQAAYATRALQYRNMATIGGDLCQQVRCWYYRAGGNAFYCRRKDSDKCYAEDGDNRYHSILGGGACLATCPSDTAPALVALGAEVKIVGESGERIAPIEEFFTPLGNILCPDEIVTELQIPTSDPDSKSIYGKFGLGNVFGPTIVSVALVARMQDQQCMSASLVLGAVSPLPWRAYEAEQMLVGEKINEDIAERAAQAAIAEATPLSMNGYKTDMLRALVKRVVLKMA